MLGALDEDEEERVSAPAALEEEDREEGSACVDWETCVALDGGARACGCVRIK